MLKFQRNYKCFLQIGTMEAGDFTHPNIEETIEIDYPITMNFSVSRSLYSDVNNTNIVFLNINPDYRTKLWKDTFNLKKYIGIELYAGYGDTMPLIFKGYVNSCYSQKTGGSTDFETTIQATDVGYLLQYGFCNINATQGVKMENVVQTMMNGVAEIEVGFLTDEFKNEQIKKDTTYIGEPLDLLTKDFSKYQVFVDNGNLHVLGERDVIPSEVYAITTNSGLLGSPRRNDTLVEADIMFEPGIKVGQSVVLLSDSLEELNGTYKVGGVTHRGIISGRQTGRVVTTVILNKGDGIFNQLNKTSNSYNSNIKGSKTGWIRPVSDRITSEFGWRTHPIFKDRRFHEGLDYATSMNTQVKASYNGTVIFTGQISGYGYVVKINHGNIDGKTVVSEYCHLSSFAVANNQQVTAGQIVAYSGMSGYATGPHLHFNIRENGTAVNPKNYVGN